MKNNLEKLLEQANAIAKVEPQNLRFRPSRPFDFFIWLNNDGFDSYALELAIDIDRAHSDRRARDESTQKKFIFAIKIILLNLLAAHKLKLKTLQAIPLGAGEFSVNTRYRQRNVSYRSFKDAYEGLQALSLINIATKGYWSHEKGYGKLTRVQSSHILNKKFDLLFPQEVIFFIRHPDEETVRLKDDKKKLLDYSDCAYSIKSRDNLAIINTCLNRHWYDLNLSELELSKLNKLMIMRHKKDSTKAPFIPFHDRSLYRIYNNGNTPEGQGFKHGGRFYGGWWEGIPSAYRKKITINGKHTVEIDYSGYHPRMLYALESQELGTLDPYLPNVLSPKWRHFGKLAFTKLLNGKTRINKPEDYHEEEIGLSWNKLLEAMELYHAPIAKYFRTGYGLELMRKDSDIAETILLYFSKKDIPCLPIHDSFIVHHAHADELKAIMKTEYSRVFEQEIAIKIDNGFELFTNEYTGQGENTLPIESILDEEKTIPHQRRLNLWLEHITISNNN